MIHRRRHVMAIGAGAEEERRRAGRDILRRQLRQRALDGEFAHRARHVHEVAEALGLGDVGEQGVDVGDADLGQHRAAVVGGKWEIAHQPTVFR